jgi:peptidoglycan hydrolase-like protein with peptidoglycan-binding domain
MGGIRTPTTAAAPGAATAPEDLSTDQVKRLQAALNKAGCKAGAVDGVMGSGTRRAVACGLEKNRLRSNDYRGLYQSLNLKF